MHRITLVMLVALCGPASAQDSPEFSFGVSAGISKKNDFERTAPFFAASARIRPGGLLVIEPEVGYWSKSSRFSDWFTRQRDLSAAVRLLVQGRGDQVRASAGLGLAMHSIEVDFGETDAPLKYSDTKLGIGLQGGLDVRVAGGLWLFSTLRGELLKGNAQTLVQWFGGARYQPRRPR